MKFCQAHAAIVGRVADEHPAAGQQPGQDPEACRLCSPASMMGTLDFDKSWQSWQEISMTPIHEGGCLCGNVRYFASGEPQRTVACHCSFCQKMTGTSFYAESVFALDAVRFIGGEMSRYDHCSDHSGKHVHVHFCPKCGTTLTLTFERWPEYRAISRGTFDDPNWVTVGSHIWTRSAQTGVALPSGIDCFARARLTLEGVPEQPERFESPVMVDRRG